MSNIIAVMNSGVIVQEGPPRDIYLQPKTKFVANFIGSTNQMTGQVTKLEGNGTATVHTDDGEICCGILDGLIAGSRVVVVVRPESINLHTQQPPIGSNVIEGKIGAAMFLGEYVDCTIELGKSRNPRNHAVIHDEIAPADFGQEAGGDDRDGKREEDQSAEHDEAGEQLAERRDRDDIAIADSDDGDDRPIHGGRNAAQALRLNIMFDQIHAGRRHQQQAKADEARRHQRAPLIRQNPPDRRKCRRISRQAEEPQHLKDQDGG